MGYFKWLVSMVALIMLVVFLFTLTQGCSKPCCPPEDVYIIGVMQNGQEIVVELPYGSINKDSIYLTRQEALAAITPEYEIQPNRQISIKSIGDI